MYSFKLKEFQEKCINELVEQTMLEGKKEILVKSPTGSGKTIILVNYIQKYIDDINPNTVFIWLTPGKGNLEEQSEAKMRKYTHNAKCKFIYDVLTGGFEAGETAFINWEVINSDKNIALRESEKKNLFDRVQEAKNMGLDFIVVIDEEHLNKTYKSNSIIQLFDPLHIIGVSATPKENESAVKIDIAELDVINSGLITKMLYINENIESNTMTNDQVSYLTNLAIDKQIAIKSEYARRNIAVNPLIIIQVPDKSNDLIEEVESYLEQEGLTYDNKMVAKWLAEEKINIVDIERNEAEPIILIMKQAVATGWDCPRAKILVKLRDNMSESFEIQTIGRIRRMPEATHYDSELLDNSYLYTFDEKFTEKVKKGLGSNAAETVLLFLKPQYKEFSLVKQYKNREVKGLGEREIYKVLVDYFSKKYKLSSDSKQNKLNLAAYGYKFDTQIVQKVIQDETVLVDKKSLSNLDTVTVITTVNTHKHGRDLHHSIGVIAANAGVEASKPVEYNKIRTILERMFRRKIGGSSKLLTLSTIEFYAFIINNESILKHDFHEAVSQEVIQMELILDRVKEDEFKIPLDCVVKYDPSAKESLIYESNVYRQYPSNAIRSLPESLFERYCQDNTFIKWVYKNGEKSQEYFSVIYLDQFQKQWSFYPDYILQTADNDIWIIETKGGETNSGVDKNIDSNAANKFQALKEYANKHNLKFGFVRDKNTSLYINYTHFEDELNHTNWMPIDDIMS